MLLFEDPALEAQPEHVVPKGYLSLSGILGGVSKSAPEGTGKHVGKVAHGVRAAQILPHCAAHSYC